MNLFIPTILKFLPDWNKRIHTELDAIKFCDRHKIILHETEAIDDLGEYRFYRNRHCILIHKYIENNYRPWVLWHEIAHFILHPTTAASFCDNQTKHKIEKEAHFVAALSLMPTYIVELKTVRELQYDFGYPKRFIFLRKEVHDLYGR
ncbi:MAG TPA: ImmA/IrrE family metallo-endopeptidase [Pyrinomonadaceae bacterium]|jgi:Zn-dependent peptidase ImmA (M78 family)